MQKITIWLLGGVRIAVGPKPVTSAKQDKVLALLAWLAMECERPHRRDALCELFWPELERSAARHNLRQKLLQIKKLFGPLAPGQSYLIVDRETVRLDPNYIELDVHRFAAQRICNDTNGESALCINETEAAVALFTGEFMEGFVLTGDLPEFELWLETQREHYHRHALRLLERLVTSYEKRCDNRSALKHAWRLIKLAGWREHSHRTLMRLLCLNNEFDTALSHYDSLQRTLAMELGVEPEPQTAELADAIRRQLEENIAAPNLNLVPLSPVRARQFVTVLYVGFGFPHHDDPEPIEMHLRMARTKAVQLLEHRGAYISHTHGTSLYAYFGYPNARENDALIALETALSIKAILEVLSTDGTSFGIGLHSGVILVDPEHPHPDPAGLTSAIAAGVVQVGPERCVLASAATLHPLGDRTQYRLVGVHRLAGIQQHCEIAVVDSIDLDDRVEVRANQLGTFVGRERELAQLAKSWSDVLAGNPQAVLVRGEAGIGKSHLVRVFRDRLSNIRALRVHCSMHNSASPFLPINDMLMQQAQIWPGAAVGPERPTSFLKQQALPAEAVQAILPLIFEPSVTALGSDKWRSTYIRSVNDWLIASAAQQPVLLIVEDIHWADPSTLELLAAMLRRWESFKQFMVICTARPDVPNPAVEGTSILLDLPPLQPDEVLALIDNVAGDSVLSKERRRAILRAGDGIPLYLEEMTRMLCEEGDSCESIVVPASLRELLAARIDLTGASKFTAQAAAVIGRDFTPALLTELTSLDSGTVQDHLLVLVRAGVISAPEFTHVHYRFRHALLHEATYESMLKTDRAQAHRKLSMLLREPGRNVPPEVLARHLSAAGELAEAIRFWVEAAHQALFRSAHYEAISHARNGLAIGERLPTGALNPQQRLKLLLALGPPLMATEGYGSQEAGEIFSSAVALAENLGDHQAWFSALAGAWRGENSRNDNESSVQLAMKMVDVADASGDQQLRNRALLSLGIDEVNIANYTSAEALLRRVVNTYDNDPGLHHWDGVEDPKVAALSTLAWGLWISGQVDTAREVADASIAHARSLGHSGSLCMALAFAGTTYLYNREPETVLKIAEELYALSTQDGLMLWIVCAQTLDGWARCQLGDFTRIEQMQEGVQAITIVMPSMVSLFMSILGDSLTIAGRVDEAIDCLNQAVEINRRLRYHFLEPGLQQLLGEALCLSAQKTLGRSCLQDALAISRRQGAATMELRTLLNLHRWAESDSKAKQYRREIAQHRCMMGNSAHSPDVLRASSMLEGFT